MHSSYTFTAGSAVFDEQNLVSSAGLVPVLELAEQTGLSRLIGEHVDLPSTRVKSGAVNPAGKLTSIIAANDLRRGQHRRCERAARRRHTPGVQRGVCAVDVGDLLARVHLRARQPARRGGPRASGGARGARAAAARGRRAVFLDIDSLLRPVYGHHKQGASFGHAKIASRALLRLGLSPQITTISTAQAAAGDRRGAAAQRAGRLRARGRLPGQAGHRHRPRAAGPRGTIMVRGDSAFGTKKVITTCVAEGVEFSLSVSRNKRISAAIEAIDEAAYTPVHYPGAVEDPDTGALISDAEVAETPYTLRLGRGRTLTVRLVVRRVKDARYPDALFPVWRYHPFVTNSELPTAEADITHRRHAIIETTFADLIDGPLAHIPSGLFAANCAWLGCAVIAHNLLRAAGTLAGGNHAVARGATLRRDLVNVPARFAAPARKPMLHLPAHWPWQTGWKTLWDNVIGYHYPTAQPRAA